MDPSYRPSLVQNNSLGSGALPFAASDLVLSPSQWSSHVVGMSCLFFLLLVHTHTYYVVLRNYYDLFLFHYKSSLLFLPLLMLRYWIGSILISL